MSISVLILTFNEEQNLPACLESVKWSDDIVVFDSFSTDRTVEIARAFGARVVQRVFDNERDHRTASLQVGFKHPWVYNPDADEVTPPDLRDEMLWVVAQPGRAEAAYRVRFKTMFCGRWLRHSGLYPTWVVRLFRPERITFERSINLRYVVDGPEGRLESHFEHYTFNKGLNAWFDKHNRYSWKEAEESLVSLRGGGFDWRGLLARHPAIRRRALKELSFRLPCRPLLRFIYMYVLRLGFLDGWAGFAYCRLLTIYEQMIVLKMREIRRRQAGLPV
jgi:glycosyltransferase involved in cell wall biosynthesis